MAENEGQPEIESVKKPGFIKQLSFTGQLTRFIVYVSAAIPAIIFIILGLLQAFNQISPITFGDYPKGEFIILFTWYYSVSYTHLRAHET